VNRGALVALEGIDGSGKTTVLPALVAALRAAGRDVVATREPTDGQYGQRIRAMARSGTRVSPEEELRWFTSDRREHVAGLISPALAAGRTVVTDRYFLSTVAYQGARGLDWREILAQSEAEFPIPDLALLFELRPEEGLARVRARGGAAEPVFERADFLDRVAGIFAAIERDYLVRIDGSGPEPAVRAAALAALAQALPGLRAR
jgi:dTMP kinase